MGTRDGSVPSIHEDLIFEPGEYILGLAGAGGGGGAYRPPVDSIGFDDAGGSASSEDQPPGGYRLTIPRRQQSPSRAETEGACHDRIRLQAPAGLRERCLSRDQRDLVHDRHRREGNQSAVGHRRSSAGRARGRSDPSSRRQLRAHCSPFKRQGQVQNCPISDWRSVPTRSRSRQKTPAISEPWPSALSVAGSRAPKPSPTTVGNWRIEPTLSQPVTGRMGAKNGRVRLLSSSLLMNRRDRSEFSTLRLETADEEGQGFRFCLLDARGPDRIQCRDGSGADRAAGTSSWTPGDWGLHSRAAGPEAAEYTVTLSTPGSRSRPESKPNRTTRSSICRRSTLQQPDQRALFGKDGKRLLQDHRHRRATTVAISR